MTFLEDRESDLSAMFSVDTFGEEVTYTPKGGDPVTVTALINRGESLPAMKGAQLYTGVPVSRDYRSTFNGGGRQASAVVWVQKSEIPAPAYGDSVTFDGEIWKVRPVLEDV